MKNIRFPYRWVLLLALSLGATTSCFDALNLQPKYGLNALKVYADPANYINVLAKIYGGLSLSGNAGPAGQGDVSGDEGFSQYLRVLWNLQELPTEEAVCAWANDASIRDLNEADWNSQSSFVNMMYARIFYQAPLCNEFIYYCSDEWMNEKNFSEADKQRIRGYKSEARFIRALSYYHAIDLFGNVPLVTEEDRPGSGIPDQASRADLFNYVEREMKELENLLPQARANEYGRADRAAAWMVLAKLYLNAEEYIGSARYADCITYCEKIMDAGYQLEPNYQWLFLADNHLCRDEVIFSVNFDGLRSQNYGGTTFLVKSSTPAAPDSAYRAKRGTDGGWGGNRATPVLFDLFRPGDSRNLLDSVGMTRNMLVWSEFGQGYLVSKFNNKTRNGDFGSDPQKNFMDIDFPMFRLADVYLMHSEAVARGGGNTARAIEAFNKVRERAFGNTSQNVSALPGLSEICDERGRELYWEAHRRSDLIRFDRFVESDYLWPFKGGVVAGQGIDPKFKLYPLPLSDLVANPKLRQNPGY